MAKTFAKAANALKSATKKNTSSSVKKSSSSSYKSTSSSTKKSTSSNSFKSTSSASSTKNTAAQIADQQKAAQKKAQQKAAQQKANSAALAKQQQAAKAAEAKRQAEIAAQKKTQADTLAKQQAAAKAAAAQREAQRKATEEAEKRSAAEALQRQRAATQAKNNSDYFSALSAAQQGYAGGGLGANSAAVLWPAMPFSWYGFLTGDGDSPMGGSTAGNGRKYSPAERAKQNPEFFSTVGQGVSNIANAVPFGLAAAAENANGSSSAYGTMSGGSSYRGGYSGGGYGGYGSGGGGGGSGDELTDEEKEAAENQNALAKMNIQDLQNQLNRQLDIYNQADAQNKRLADAERNQASRKAESDRFDAQRNLQAASLSLFGDMGQAMNGSATGNLMRMLENRNDLEDNAQLSQLLSNWEQTNNQYNDTLNQNRIARMEAMANAEKAINDATRNWMAALNNIDPSLFPKDGPVNGDKSLAASTAWKRKSEGAAPTSSFIYPFVRADNRGKGGTPQGTANPAQSMNVGYTRNRQLGGDYFSRLLNQFNRR